jgi:gamma-glutamyltranspeptidase/glutathione hydrolase
MAIKDGKPFMAFGTPGGDVQIQVMVQVFLNATQFGMDIQSAIDAPRFSTYSFPSSFAPNDYFPGLLMLEGRIADGDKVHVGALEGGLTINGETVAMA